MIIGDRIRFRAIEREDLPTFLKWINDPEVRQGLGIYLPLSMLDEEDWFEGMRKHPPMEHNLVIEVRQPIALSTLPGGLAAQTDTVPEQAGWKMIGNCGFFNLNACNRCAEFGIMIGDKSYWNQGYGTEAVRLLLKH